ncbi:MAG: hypothetical protein HQ582_31060, partial [Planctomycetes bacterium]|nr:hypothetical protein [Planctomycetota bacterium]
GDDTIRVTPSDALIAAATPGLSLRFTVVGDAPNASDRLSVVDAGDGDTVIQRLGADDRSGTFNVGPLAPVVYQGIEYAQVVPLNPISGATGANFDGKLVVFKHDPFESNDSLFNAYFLGSGATINVDPTIDPPGDTIFSLPGDTDFFQFVAAETGTLDFQVYFEMVAELANGRAGLPGDGDLDVRLYDSDGLPVSIGGGMPLVDLDANTIGERVVIPVVRNETYFMQVVGATDDAVNVYNFTVINVPAPVPQLVDLVAATDSGRHDSDDVTFFDDNPLGFDPAMFDIVLDDDRIDEFTNLDLRPDTNDDDKQEGDFDYGVEVFNNAVSIGFAYFIPGGNTWRFTATNGDLIEGHNNFISAAVWIRDAADSEANGRGELSAPLQVTLDTIAPPVTIIDIDPALSDTGVEGQPATFVDRITSDTATGFVGRAEADAIVRLYVDTAVDHSIAEPAEYSLTVAVPLDGNDAFPEGQWNTAFIHDLNDPSFFPLDGLREVLVTAEDLAGNVNRVDDQIGDVDQTLDIFVDTRGPTVEEVTFTANGQSVFAPKPTAGPTPLVESLDVRLCDLPLRTEEFNYLAVNEILATTPGNYELVGDANGHILIESVELITATDDGAHVGQDFTFTFDADFDQSTMIRVDHDAPYNDQLQLGLTGPLPFINVASSGLGTVVRVNTDTGEVVGEYRTAPAGRFLNPSRTTVDHFGNVWVTNRDENGGDDSLGGSIVKVGIVVGGTRGDKNPDGSFAPNPNGDYLQPPFAYSTAIDRDGDGLIRTSGDLGHVLDWPNATDGSGGGLAGGSALVEDALDEAITVYQRLPHATHARHVSVNEDNDVWVGGYGGAGERWFYKLEQDTGAVLDSWDNPSNWGGYGGLMDGNGVIWSGDWTDSLLRFDPATKSASLVSMNSSYGLGLDSDGNIWNSNFTYNTVTKIDPDGNILGQYATGGASGDRGVAVTPADGHVWVANSYGSDISRLDSDGNVLKVIPVGNTPTGVAVDANGNVWVTNQNSDNTMRIDPNGGGDNLGAVDMTVSLRPGASPYNYSDMTGAVLGTAMPQGWWTLVQDGGAPDAQWSSITWNEEANWIPHPGMTSRTDHGSSITVEARTADNQAGLAGQPWTAVTHGAPLGLAGQFIEVRSTLLPGEDPLGEPVTPVLSDLTIHGGLASMNNCAIVRLHFAEPLPDDRFTLTVYDRITDDAGNALDGDVQAASPGVEADLLPSGDGVPGEDFVARFTVDSRAEIGTWSAGSVYVDTNGNFVFDPKNLDYTNRDIVYTMGFTTDDIFAGNFVAGSGDTADGFDKLAAYGQNQTGVFRWVVDVDNDGVADIISHEPVSFPSGTPVAGNFDGNAANGDEVGLFTGEDWYLDTDHDFLVSDEAAVNPGLIGYPIVGDFDGDGADDLATYLGGVFSFDLAGVGGLGNGLDAQFAFSYLDFIGVRERPVAADMNGDGIDDVGLWVPDRAGAAPEEGGEWFFLLSGGDAFVPDDATDTVLDRIVHVDGLDVVEFTPYPFGHDLFAQFGDEYAAPIVGNFDPPVTGSSTDPPSDTLTLEGTAADDTFEVVVDGAGEWTVLRNGVDMYVAPEVVNLTIDGLDGNDTITVTGTAGNDVLDLSPGGGTLTGDGYSLTLQSAESIAVDGGGGADLAFLHDNPAGKDTFTGDPDSGTLSGDGYENQVTSFRYVHVYGTAGNVDVAFLQGDPNAQDTFESWPDQAKLRGDDYFIRVKNMPYVHAHGTPGGNDLALLHDDADGFDTFEGRPDYSKLSGDGYFVRANDFRYVHAYATAGGGDLALLHGEPGSFDKLDAWPDRTKLFGEDFFVHARSFGYMHAYSTPGDGDLALLHDAGTDDTFTAWPDQAKLTGPDLFLRAKSFRYVHAYATEGDDAATFYGSDARDVFVGNDRSGKLRGADFYNRAVAFEELYVHGGGGRDVAVLHDAALESGLTNPVDATQLAWLYEFERIRQYNDPETGADNVINALDELFTAYWP